MQRYFRKRITTYLFVKVAINPNYPSKNPNTFYHNYLSLKQIFNKLFKEILISYLLLLLIISYNWLRIIHIL